MIRNLHILAETNAFKTKSTGVKLKSHGYRLFLSMVFLIILSVASLGYGKVPDRTNNGTSNEIQTQSNKDQRRSLVITSKLKAYVLLRK
jgi:hypothetical protein